MFFALSVTTRILTAVGEAAISATCYPLAIYQFSKQNEGKALVRNNAGKQVILGGGGGVLTTRKSYSVHYICLIMLIMLLCYVQFNQARMFSL